jgi:hypothetical protein
MREIEELVTTCSSCGSFVGFPNVYLAEGVEEQQALDARYTEAVSLAATDGTLTNLQEFEEAAKLSSAVVSMSVARLRSLAVNKNELYSNYDLAVRAQARRPALARNDQRRRAVDAKLWGTAAGEIRYAALSIDGRGLKSYGDCFVRLDDHFISHRASVLEQNSFSFLKEVTFAEETPIGFRSNWDDRYKVAVAKCQSQILGHTKPSEFPSILLKAGDSRSNDEFIEVHVYGGFDFSACSSVITANVPRTREDKASLRIAKQYALAAKKGWTDDTI